MICPEGKLCLSFPKANSVCPSEANNIYRKGSAS